LRELPLFWLECPYCGDTERLGQDHASSPEAYEGQPGIEVKMIAAGPMTGIVVSMLMVYSDICTACGRQYTTKIEKKNVPVNLMNMGGGPQFPKGM